MLTIRKEQMDAMSAVLRRPIVLSCNRTWVQFKLIDENGDPVPSVAYTVKLPDGSMQEGKLDSQGLVRFDNIDPGQCEITFTEIDGNASL
jgi:hypothetical protein